MRLAEILSQGRLHPMPGRLLVELEDVELETASGLLFFRDREQWHNDGLDYEIATVRAMHPDDGELFAPVQVGDRIIIRAGGVPGVDSAGKAGSQIEDDLIAVEAREVWAVIE